jgi:histidine triad (HIT) family protein
MMDAVVKVGRIVQNAVTPSGINLISSAGEAAEQTIFHLHFHVVPRYKGDDLGLIWPPKTPPEAGLVDALLHRMQSACEEEAVSVKSNNRQDEANY